MLNLAQIRENPQVREFIKQTEVSLAVSGYTEHGLAHSTLVADRARMIAAGVGLSGEEQELAAIAGFCHDMGNFLSRTYHHYLGALLFQQVFSGDFEPGEMSAVTQAIANHDKEEMRLSNCVSAVVVLADKSDVRRSRVITKEIDKIKADIHDRVNFATKESDLRVDGEKKKVILTLKIDTSFVPVIEYFEIFTYRMIYCRKAAEYLGYQFSLVINDFQLL
jgi:hypothetical protein